MSQHKQFDGLQDVYLHKMCF